MEKNKTQVIGATADDRLSRCASALLALADRESWAYEEIALFHAPSECASGIHRDTERAASRILREHGYTAVDFADELEIRTCGRFTHCEAGALILSALPEPEEEAEVWS